MPVFLRPNRLRQRGDDEWGRQEGEKVRTGVTLVGVHARWTALGEGQVVLVGDLVRGEFAAGEELAGVAVAVCPDRKGEGRKKAVSLS